MTVVHMSCMFFTLNSAFYTQMSLPIVFIRSRYYKQSGISFTAVFDITRRHDKITGYCTRSVFGLYVLFVSVANISQEFVRNANCFSCSINSDGWRTLQYVLMNDGGWASSSSINLLLLPQQQCNGGIFIESSAQVLNPPPL